MNEVKIPSWNCEKKQCVLGQTSRLRPTNDWHGLAQKQKHISRGIKPKFEPITVVISKILAEIQMLRFFKCIV